MRSNKVLEAKLEALVDITEALEKRVNEVDEKNLMLQARIYVLEDRLRDKEDIISEQEKEIRKWNEGIANIMNYSLDVAKGGNKP